jgi:hypothetical protein
MIGCVILPVTADGFCNLISGEENQNYWLVILLLKSYLWLNTTSTYVKPCEWKFKYFPQGSRD